MGRVDQQLRRASLMPGIATGNRRQRASPDCRRHYRPRHRDAVDIATEFDNNGARASRNGSEAIFETVPGKRASGARR